jgi:hypothetical protein
MNMVFTEEWHAEFEKAMQRFIKAHNIRCEALTEHQMAEALRQAIASGDFVRHVRVLDDSQEVVYEPFRQAEALKSENERLRTALLDIIACPLTEEDEKRNISRYHKASLIAQSALNNEP